MALSIIIVILYADQLSKLLVHKYLLFNHSIPVIKGIFYLTHVQNRGAAFGILKNQIPLFIFVSICTIIFIYFYLKKNISLSSTQGEDRQKKFTIFTLSLCLISAGALGNLIDRIFLGYVLDFLDFRVWPVFNLADSAITVGAILLGLSILNSKKHVS